MSPYGWSWVNNNMPTNTSTVTATATYATRVAKLVATWALTKIISPQNAFKYRNAHRKWGAGSTFTMARGNFGHRIGVICS